MNMTRPLRIAIGKDNFLWHQKFAGALDEKIAKGHALDYSIVNLAAHDWQIQIEPYDVVIWNPTYMGPVSAGHLKEKIFFAEKALGKLVLPNYATVWHFESKIAQSYLFAQSCINIPRTTVSFDYHDAIEQVRHTPMPIVWKASHGAASKNVRLICDRRIAEQEIAKAFCVQLWSEAKQRFHSRVPRLFHCLPRPWFWAKVRQKIVGGERLGSVYWQEFIANNSRDLRITVIGDRFAFGFWRNNRPNDFRASGSGLIDYQSQIPETPLRYCVALNRAHSFDSMCYDILFTPENFVLTEMSYNYVDSAIHKANGYFELIQNDQLVFREEHTWPQKLWVEWALIRANRARRDL